MTEMLVVGGAVASLVLIRFLNERADPETLLWLSAFLIGGGFAVGLPCGAVYHVRLARALAALGRLESRWWLHPTALHARLDEGARRRVLPWFRGGAAGFLLVAAGCALLFVLALRVAFLERSGG